MKKIYQFIILLIVVFSLTACANGANDMHCFNCGKSVSKDALFCEYCGIKIDNTIETSSTTSEASMEQMVDSVSPDIQQTTEVLTTEQIEESTKELTAEPSIEPTTSVTVPTTSEPTHAHSYTKEITIPTCTKRGYTTFTCSCGDSYIDDYTAQTTHSYSKQVTAPTCSERGYTTFTCSCGDSYKGDYVAQIAHSYSKQVTAPTCTTQGYTTFTCSCGDSYKGDYTLQLAHSYSKQVFPPTCTTQGYTTYTCSCGDSYTADYFAQTAHSYSQKITVPTCTAQGYTTYTCSCGHSYTSDYVNASHSYDQYICLNCGQIDKTHSYEYLIAWVIKNGAVQDSAIECVIDKFSNAKYSISYSTQFNNLTVNYISETNGNVAFASIHLDSYFYGFSFLDNKILGYLDARNYTKDSSISYSSYEGLERDKDSMLNLAKTSVNVLIESLKYFLLSNNIGITVADLGFTSYK